MKSDQNKLLTYLQLSRVFLFYGKFFEIIKKFKFKGKIKGSKGKWGKTQCEY